MSRIGRLPIKLPAGVTVTVADSKVTVKGPLGTLEQYVDPVITVKVEDGHIVLTRANEEKPVKAKHGLYRALIHNMVEGVTKGYKTELIISSVGVKVAVNGNKAVLNIGYSHPVEVVAPTGVTFELGAVTANQVELAVKGIDKQIVGQCAASIKAVKKIEPYHGYGIRYKSEPFIKKEGKTAGKGA